MRLDPDNQISHSVMFAGVEELEEAAQALEWKIDYRQLRKGAFSAEFASLESGEISLVSERFNNHLHIHAEPPEGFIGLFLPRLAPGRAEACGRALTEGDLIVFPSRSELEFVTSGQVRNETVFLAETEFRAAVRSLAPSDTFLSSRSAAILHGDPKRFAEIQHEIDSVHRTGGLDSNTTSNLLARIILWMVDGSSRCGAERLANGAAATIARQAQTFIEERFHDAIRLEDLCVFTGVGLRTLQCCFASHFQISPTDYIKARRLNAARRDLIVAGPSSRSVTKIALENGFPHLGRFSANYRAYFRELPSETLKAKTADGQRHPCLQR
jgi:AraC family ethanolamine operon transcriptional activator